MKKAFLLCIFLFLYAGIQAQDRTDSMHVAHYDVHLNITDFSNRVIYGYTDVRMVSKVENLDHLDLDLKNMVVDSVWVNGSGTSNYVHSGELLRILLTDAINQDDTVNIRVYYGGVPSGDSDLGGFYFRGEYCYNLGVSMRCVPHSYGRVWFPCMDFFTDKSTYQFSIETEANKRAICGGELRDSVVTDSNTIIWNWSLDLPVPVYLVSVAVGEYAHYADTVQGMERVLPIDIYSVPSHYADIEPTFGHLKDVIHLYESLYGPYPWNRVGYVGVDFNMGAMEHVTNIAYPNFAFSGPYYESLYIHEFSHMWFGDLITCNRAEEMWINEGFARYNEAVADEYLYPSDDPAVDGYKTKIRGLHRGVLADAHVDDNGYWALDSMPLNVTYGMGIDEHDHEGRVITLEMPDFFLVTVYTPNSQDELRRLDYRMKWEDDFRNFLLKLNAQKPVIVCGDMNVAHEEIDLKNPKTNRRNAGFTDEEREKFTTLLNSGFTDTFRWKYPEQVTYSWWSYRFQARQKNAGWRIDYFVVSNRLQDYIDDAKIHTDILGSDHCPVELSINLP